MSLKGVCTSSKTETESFSFGDKLEPFRKLSLGKGDVTEIITYIATIKADLESRDKQIEEIKDDNKNPLAG